MQHSIKISAKPKWSKRKFAVIMRIAHALIWLRLLDEDRAVDFIAKNYFSYEVA